MKYTRNCPQCDKELSYNQKSHLNEANRNNRMCLKCSKTGKNNSGWKGGTTIDRCGYIRTKNYDIKFASMSYKDGYMLEHRLIKAQQLDRCLTSKEFVHHINGIRDDNRIENLQLCTPSEHNQLHKK